MENATDTPEYVDRESGAVLLGDHLVEGSDLDTPTPSAALSALVQSVGNQGSIERVLLVGHHAARTLSQLPVTSRADVVLRHLEDVRAVVSGHADRTEDRHFCGGFELFAAETSYDLIVLVGGGPEVLSPVPEGMSDAAIVHKAAGMLADDGILLHGSVNPLGLHDLLALEPEVSPDDDSRWFVGNSALSRRPLLLAELDSALDEAGVHTVGRLAAYPSVCRSHVLVDVSSLPRGREALARHEATAALTRYLAHRPSARRADGTVELTQLAGLDLALAPGWVTVLSRGDVTLDLPSLITAEDQSNDEWTRVAAFDRGGDAQLTWGDGRESGAEKSALGVSRRLTPPESFTGSTLEELMREAALDNDHATLRSLVKTYHEWMHPSSFSGPRQSMTGLTHVDLSAGSHESHADLEQDDTPRREDNLAEERAAMGEADEQDAAELGLGFDPVLADEDVDAEALDTSRHSVVSAADNAACPHEAPAETGGDDDDSARADGAASPWFATPDNVAFDDDGTLRMIDDSWALANGTASQLAFLRGLRVFATGLLAAGAPTMWRLPITPETALRHLASMAGVTVTDSDIEMIALLETEVALAIGDASGDSRELVRKNLADGARDNNLPSPTASGYRELVAHLRRLAQTTRAQERQIAWLEGTLKLRDRRIKEYDRLMFKLEESLSYKAMRAVGAPKRIAVSKARNRVEEAIPPSLRGRAKRALDRAISPDNTN